MSERRGARSILLVLFLFLILSSPLFAQYRFPQPEFTEGYAYLQNELPRPPNLIWDYIDCALLLAGLIASALISYKYRKRLYILALMLLSLVYFGFVRKGCFCPIGAMQPVMEALFNPEIVIPLSNIIFFALPLIFALFLGRVFCSGVCPLGALQDFVLIKNIRLPKTLAAILEMLPPVFLSLALISAITGSEYLICTLDPFVPLFRASFGHSPVMYSALWLISSLFIARPYCRFLCPYGFLLKLASSVSKYRMVTTPAECVSCRLCENSCPIDALEIPDADHEVIKKGKSRLRIKFFILPVLIAAAALWGRMMGPYLSELHPDVRLAGYFEDPNEANELDREIYLATENTLEELEITKDAVMKEWTMFATVFGAVLGLFLGLKLIMAERKREEYIPSKGGCVHCLRCVEHCPVEARERKQRGIR